MVYKHYISLGYFCSVALELERAGLRSASYPIDWLVTPDMEQVMRMITGSFEGFLDADALEQNESFKNKYVNKSTGFTFVHDFDGEKPLSEQIGAVREKFNRRIDRFYADIHEPTLFVRYISDEQTDSEGYPTDLKWCEDHFEYILQILRSYNSENDIIWIANEGLNSSVIPDIYHVTKDENDTVARRPMDKNEDLRRLFWESIFPDRENNLAVYRKKQRKKNNIFYRLKNKLGK